jgi:hypothetical protein
MLTHAVSRQRPGGKAHFARSTVGDNVDCIEVMAPIECGGHLPRRRIDRVQQDRLDARAQSGQQDVHI